MSALTRTELRRIADEFQSERDAAKRDVLRIAEERDTIWAQFYASERELITLRISLARVAQVAGTSLAHLGLQQDASYSALHHAASINNRGWNRLAAEIIGTIEELKRERDLR